MDIERISTFRNFEKWPSYDLVYEWEDIIEKTVKVPFVNLNPKFLRIGNKIHWLNWIMDRKCTFGFEMTSFVTPRFLNNKYFIPCIVDFYIYPNQIKSFEKSYSQNQIVFISSKEAYDFLLENKCRLNIKHLPLTISDIYNIDSKIYNQKKEYDLVLMGRQNHILHSYLNTYIERHPDFKYVYRVKKGNDFIYINSDGKELGNINTRSQYISLMKKARCGLYATPGIDGGEERTKGFSQVTPRFLELIACGCHILARYKENSDTIFYQLNKFSPSINSYEEFEYLLSKKINSSVDMNFYRSYLSSHYTSVIAQNIININ